MDKEIKKRLASNWFKLLQNTICNDIEKLEGKKIKFKSKTWSRNEIKDEGGGEFRILKDGKIFEKEVRNISKNKNANNHKLVNQLICDYSRFYFAKFD